MAKTPKLVAVPRFNLSVQTLRIAYQALISAPKNSANDMGLCANAMLELEAVLGALPQDAPPPVPVEEAPVPTPTVTRRKKGTSRARK